MQRFDWFVYQMWQEHALCNKIEGRHFVGVVGKVSDAVRYPNYSSGLGKVESLQNLTRQMSDFNAVCFVWILKRSHGEIGYKTWGHHPVDKFGYYKLE